jgi:hypothetical protein
MRAEVTCLRDHSSGSAGAGAVAHHLLSLPFDFGGVAEAAVAEQVERFGYGAA